MKIYNEITLEWNEDTKRYDKVISEDSYEYDGELELAQYGTFAPAGRLKAETMGRQTQWNIIDAAKEQAKKQAGHFGLGSIFSFITSAVMTSMGVPYSVAKGITDSIVAATYKPKKFKSETGWGTKRYEQLTERDKRAKSGAWERAGMSAAQNMLLSFVYPELFEGMETKLKGTKAYKSVFGPTAPTNPKFANMPSLDKQYTGGIGMDYPDLSQYTESAIPTESLSSMLGQPGGVVPGLGTEMAPKLGFPQARPLQEQMQFGQQQFQLDDAPLPYESAPLPESWGVRPEVPIDFPVNKMAITEALSTGNPMLQQMLLGGAAQDMPLTPTPSLQDFPSWYPVGYRTPPGFKMKGVPFMLRR